MEMDEKVDRSSSRRLLLSSIIARHIARFSWSLPSYRLVLRSRRIHDAHIAVDRGSGFSFLRGLLVPSFTGKKKALLMSTATCGVLHKSGMRLVSSCLAAQASAMLRCLYYHGSLPRSAAFPLLRSLSSPPGKRNPDDIFRFWHKPLSILATGLFWA
jgi:hypothetical protein